MGKVISILFLYLFGFVLFFTIIHYFNLPQLFEEFLEIGVYQSIKKLKIAKYNQLSFTKIKPDETSSPLTLSKELLGQLTWYL